MDEVRMHLAYHWFTLLDFSQQIPDHSTFSKNRHGRFRQSGVFREVFAEIVRRCLEVGLVEGKNLAVDGTLVGANAGQQSRASGTVSRGGTDLTDRAAVPGRAGTTESPRRSRTDANCFKAGLDHRSRRRLDGGEEWACVAGLYDNYPIDTHSRVF